MGSHGCAQQSPHTGQDELAGCLLQSDVLLQLKGFFCFGFFFFNAGRDYLLTHPFPTPGLEVSCKGKLVAAA